MTHKFIHLGSLNKTFELYSNIEFDQTITPPPMKDISFEQKIKNELDIFGFIVSMHPMEYYRSKITNKKIIYAKDLKKYIDKFVKVSGILITAKTILTKDSKLMQFVSFEDETDIFEAVFFPEVYNKFALMLSYQEPYILYGKVESEWDVLSFNVHDIECVVK